MAKTTKKSLQENLTRQGLKLTHGYEVKKRKSAGKKKK